MSAAVSRVATQAIAAPQAPTQAAAVAEAPRELHGFELVRDEFVHEYDSYVRTYRHKRTGELPTRSASLAYTFMRCRTCRPPSAYVHQDDRNTISAQRLRKCLVPADWGLLCEPCTATGAEVMSLVNSDENKTFGVVLRTPVENSKGIPHILEHSVLCGSRKYPIKVCLSRPRVIAVMLWGCSGGRDAFAV